VQNQVTFASKFGDQYLRWTGFDFTVDARLSNGLFFQGGLSDGHTVTDNCAVIQQVPEGVVSCRCVDADTVLSPRTGTYRSSRRSGLTRCRWWEYSPEWRVPEHPGPATPGQRDLHRPLRLSRRTPLGPIFWGQRRTAQVNVLAPERRNNTRLNQLDWRITKIIKNGRQQATEPDC